MSDERAILVTGGAGFIGSHLTERLLDNGHDVVVADNLSRGGLEKIDHLLKEIEFRSVDHTTYKGCIEATEDGRRCVPPRRRRRRHPLHPARECPRPHVERRDEPAHVGGHTCQRHQPLHVCLIGLHLPPATRRPQPVLRRPGHPRQPALDVRPGESPWRSRLRRLSRGRRRRHGRCPYLQLLCRESLNPDSSHVIPSLCRKIIEAGDGDSIELFGDGTQERGFIYVTDLAGGMIRAMGEKTDGEPINLGNGDEVVSINELVEAIIDISGKDLEIEHDLSKPTGTDEWAEAELEETNQKAVADGGNE